MNLVMRNVVRVLVVDMAALRERRDDDQRNAGAVTEEVQGLNVAGVEVAAAFVEGDEDQQYSPTLQD